jgi:hypothetical protein
MENKRFFEVIPMASDVNAIATISISEAFGGFG